MLIRPVYRYLRGSRIRRLCTSQPRLVGLFHSCGKLYNPVGRILDPASHFFDLCCNPILFPLTNRYFGPFHIDS